MTRSTRRLMDALQRETQTTGRVFQETSIGEKRAAARTLRWAVAKHSRQALWLWYKDMDDAIKELEGR